MILTTDITLATTTSTATAQKKSYPNVITGPATSNATEDAVYKLTQYTYKTGKTVVSSPSAADQLIFNEDKENISWMFWVDGGLMDEDDEYIIIENKTLTDDSENDFTNESNKIQFQENLQANAYLEASIEVVEEGGETINKLTIKFSKWLDGYNIYIEPFRNSPDHSETEDYVETTMINASPEIIEVYWLNDQGKKVASIGYESEIDLVIHSLGIGNEQLDLSLYDDDSTDSTVDILNWNDGTTVKSETISERFTIISYDVEEEGHANYANALTDDSNSVVEAFVKIITTNTTLQPTLEDQYARIDFTPLEEVKTYLALREEVTINGQEYTQYNKLERVFPGMKAYLVAEVANLTGAVSFSITEETPLLEVANVKLPLLQNDVEGTDFAATIEDNYAITEVLFQELDSDTYDDWIALLMPATGTPAESEINIKVTVGTDEYDSAETLKITAPIVIQKIYHDGFISKENYIKDVAKKVKFEFHDTATNSPHDLGTFDLKWVQRWLYPGRTSSPGGVRGIDYVRHYKKKKADGTIVYAHYRHDIDEKAPLVSIFDTSTAASIHKVFEPQISSQTFVRISDNSEREYFNPERVAALIGAVKDTEFDDVTLMGSVQVDETQTGVNEVSGTGSPSLTHVNGNNIDLRWLRTDEKRPNIDTLDASTTIAPRIVLNTTSGRDLFDHTRMNTLIDALHKFGWARVKDSKGRYFLGWKYGDDEDLDLNKTTKAGSHHHHLHIQGFLPRYK